MSKLIKNRYRILALLVMATILGAATFAFANTNTVTAGVAGEGAGNISGYTVDSVHYTLNSTTPNLFTSVSIDLNAPATANNVYAGVSGVGGVPATWATCTLNAGTVWDCPVSGSVDAAMELHVAAAQ